MRKHLFIVLLILLTTGKIVAQNITGIVVDENQAPLLGVNVTVKDTSVGTVTDAQGQRLPMLRVISG